MPFLKSTASGVLLTLVGILLKMTVNDRCFVEWKEQFVSQERGNRVVHYYLKDSGGESVLAVVGTERSVRHMCYVAAEEFLEICGKEGCVPAGFKWRSRREVVDWLTSMLSKQLVQGERSGKLILLTSNIARRFHLFYFGYCRLNHNLQNSIRMLWLYKHQIFWIMNDDMCFLCKTIIWMWFNKYFVEFSVKEVHNNVQIGRAHV